MKKTFITLLATMLTATLWAQENPWNTGLKAPQDPQTLPQSQTEVVWPERKPKQNIKSQLVKANNNTYIINNGWELAEANKITVSGAKISRGKANTSAWYNATVPGTVLTTLVAQGVYPDPYYGLNNMVIPDTLCRQNWWYYNQFDHPNTSKGQRVWLLFNGINYQAHIWLNGQKLGEIKGAFIRGEYEVTNLLEDKNHLAVQIIPPPNPGIPHEQSARWPKGPNGGQLCQDGPTFICSEGWDWMPGIRDRNIGIWQDVRLKITGQARIIDPMVVTDLNLPDADEANLTLKTTIEAQQPGSYVLAGTVGDNSFSQKITLKKGKNQVVLTPEKTKGLTLKNPKLWWPNGYGEPNLYTMQLTLKNANNIADSRQIRFGVRELEYELAVATPKHDFLPIGFNPIDAHRKQPKALFNNMERQDGPNGVKLPTLNKGIDVDLFTPLQTNNPYLVIKVNGVPIFCKGGNWGIDDAMKRVSRQRLEPYFKLHQEANYNMIRNWTGECTEEVFFELADEYGMLVWNDFWMSTQGYNFLPIDFDLFMQNATDVVKRFANHPSIALWCARNEGYAPPALDEKLANLIATEDGTRMYQGNSRYLNLRPSGPWNYRRDINYYFDERAEGFSTEVGTMSITTADNLKSFMPDEDVWPISDAWYYHDLHTGHEDFRAAIIDEYGETFTLDEFAQKAQFLNYRSHRAIFEAWNAKLWDQASGILLWMTHPAWPSIIWQTYAWNYQTHGAYYGAKKACEPVHIQLNNHDNKVLLVNTSRSAFEKAKVVATIYNLEGKQLQQYDTIIDCPANQKTNCFVFTPKKDFMVPVLIRLQLLNNKGDLLSQNTYWQNKDWRRKYMGLSLLPKVVLKATVNATTGTEGTITLTNPGSTVAVNVNLNLVVAGSNELVLPAYFSDGYFQLLPGETRTLTYSTPKATQNLAVQVSGFNLADKQVIEAK